MAQNSASTWKPETALRKGTYTSFRYDQSLPLKNSRLADINAVLESISNPLNIFESAVSEATINAIKEAETNRKSTDDHPPLRIEFSDDIPTLSDEVLSAPAANSAQSSKTMKRNSYSPSSPSSLTPKSRLSRKYRRKSLMNMSRAKLIRECSRLKIRRSLPRKPSKGEIVDRIIEVEFGEKRKRNVNGNGSYRETSKTPTWKTGGNSRKMMSCSDRMVSRRYDEPLGLSLPKGFSQFNLFPKEQEKQKRKKRKSGLPRPKRPNGSSKNNRSTVPELHHASTVPIAANIERSKTRRTPRKVVSKRPRSKSRGKKKTVSKKSRQRSATASNRSESLRKQYRSFRYDENSPMRNTTMDRVTALLQEMDSTKVDDSATVIPSKKLDDETSENDEVLIDSEIKEQLQRWSYSIEEIRSAYKKAVDKDNIMELSSAIEESRASTSLSQSSD